MQQISAQTGSLNISSASSVIYTCSQPYILLFFFVGLLNLTQISLHKMQLNVIYSLLTGRLVREKVDPAVQRVVRSQVSLVVS